MKSDVHNLNAAKRFGRSGPEAEPYNAHMRRVPSNTRQIEIQRGDTLGELAQGTGLSVEELAVLNNLADPNSIRAGALLDVPADFNRANVDHAIGQRQPRQASLPPPAFPGGMNEPGSERAALSGPQLPPSTPPEMPGAPAEVPPMLAAPGPSPSPMPQGPGVNIPQALPPGMSGPGGLRDNLPGLQGGNAPLEQMPPPPAPTYDFAQMGQEVADGAYGSAALAGVPALATAGGLTMGAGLAPLGVGGALSSGASSLGSGAAGLLGSLGPAEIAGLGGATALGSGIGSAARGLTAGPASPAQAAPQQLLPPTPQATLPGREPMIQPSEVIPMSMNPGPPGAIEIDPATGLPIPAGMTLEQYRQIMATANPPYAVQR